jgi:hypothetical protein
LHAGALVADEASAPGSLSSTVQSASWAFSVTPLDGWGPRSGRQQATAGWLAALPVFEPHWQACDPLRDQCTFTHAYSASADTDMCDGLLSTCMPGEWVNRSKGTGMRPHCVWP